MSAGPDAAPTLQPPTEPGRRARRAAARKQAAGRRRVSVIGVFGELLITAGALVLAFIGWQLWIGDTLIGDQLEKQAAEQSEAWNEAARQSPPPTPDGTDEPDDPTVDADPQPPVEVAPANAVPFGRLLVPRWGSDYLRPIAEGVGVSDVLNKGELGHYPSTQMPGELGNFAIAAHRTTKGGSLHRIHELQLGDHIYVETAAGWYQYSFRNLEYVRASGVGVLDPVPQTAGAVPSESYITLTSCNPILTSVERIIAYGVYDRFYPRDPSKPAAGAPEEIAPTVIQAAGV
ncbi:class E sortase [Protaetiibacter larvae]|uniref:Class E sortase n=1 Tax=Protaetiibacter larvae TaxID=2592654 RepID=A0A5C1Y7Z8_9MICO|nr:class E sortase [Protaetiibacter larvae]QEO09062.1 class E sortase [Protaetiibacter larvae]